MDIALTAWPEKHSYYAELIANPPKGVRYHLHPLKWHAPVWRNRWVNAAYWKLRAARRLVRGLPEPARVPDWGAPVHAGQELLRSPRPWVVDFEHPGVFVGFDGDRLRDPAIRERVLDAFHRDCRALLPWTGAAALATRTLFPEVKDRLHVVPPAIQARERAQEEDPESPLVLFVGGGFRFKGGPEALEAFARARREACPGARMLMISSVPEDVQRKYRDEGVTFLPPTQPRERVLREGFGRASVYLGPTHYDTFGMVFLEAFAHGVPVVMTDNFGAHDIVTDGEDGYVVEGYSVKWWQPDGTQTPGLSRWSDLERALPVEAERPRLVNDLADRLGKLLGDPELRRRMGDAAHRKVTEGPFSVEARNRTLRQVYDGAFA